jgi:ParB-like chromosome segregation protein Spo0J
MSDGLPALKPDEIDPKKLANHPLNAQLYGTTPDAEFVASVKRLGVLTPIEITHSGIIISGHRRKQAAVIAELERVPVLMNKDALTDLEIRQRIIEANRQRNKTKEEIAREYAELLLVEKALAEQRMKAGKPCEKNFLGSGAAGKAADRAAAKVGISRPTAEKAAEVVQQIDKATAAGDTEKAAELRHELNQGTVAAAHRKATGPTAANVAAQEKGKATAEILDETGQKVPQHLWAVFAARADFDAVLGLMKQVVGGVRKLANVPAGVCLPFNVFKCDHDNARNTITFARPFAVCRPCHGQGTISGQDCKACKARGWLTKDEFGQLPKGEPANG